MNELTRRGFFGAVAVIAAPKPAELPALPFDPFAGGGPWSNLPGPSIPINPAIIAKRIEELRVEMTTPWARYQPRMHSTIMPLSLALRLEEDADT